jgi:DNA modification methylase
MNNNTLKDWTNTIQCMDCLEGLKQLPDNSIDLLMADPPYGISKKLNCKGKRLGTSAKLDFEFGEWDKFNEEWIKISIPKVKGWFISFCAKKDLGTYWNALEQDGFIAIDALVWQKPDPLPLNAKSRFLNAWEVAIIGKKPGATWNSTYQHNILKYQAPKGKNRFHPTQKPIELIKQLIELTTNKNDLVVDPFMGSGTTAAASKMLGRNYIGFEVDKEYCRKAIERVESTPTALF